MSKRILLEDTWEFRRTGTVTESQHGSLLEYEMPGIFSVCDVTNGNNRRYKRSVWEANLKEDTKLQTLIKRNASFGQLEHPENGTVDLRSPISHRITGLSLTEKGELAGKLVVLAGPGLPDGQKLKSLVESGYNPLVSTRGYGTVIRASDGIDEVQDDFICEGADVVSVPSFTEAEMRPNRKAPTSESVKKDESLLIAVHEVPSPVFQAPTQSQKSNETIMDINQIRNQVQSLRGVNILKLSSRAITESFTSATTLHRELAAISASNASSSWDCTALHEELNEIEKGWHGSIQQIIAENSKLATDRQKLVLVGENLAKTAKAYRTQLTETYRKHQTLTTLFETAQRRGRGWYSIAEKRGKQNESFNHQIDVSCAALEMIAEQLVNVQSGKDRNNVIGEALKNLAEKYHADTTRLARALVETKYPEAAAKPEIKKKLDEAKTADDVLRIRKEIEAPEAPVVPAAPVTEGKTAPVALNEGKPAEAKPSEAKPAPITENVTAIKGDIISVGGLTMEQAVGVSRRLATAPSK